MHLLLPNILSYPPNGDLKISYDYNIHKAFRGFFNKDIEVTFVKGKEDVIYRWNADSLAYLPEFLPGLKLNAQKIEALNNMEDGEEIEEAFKEEIAHMEKYGTRKQKKYWRKRHDY